MSLIGCASSLGWIYVFLWRHGRVHPEPWGQAYFQWLTGNAWAARLLVQHGCFFAIGCLLWLCFFQRITFTRVLVIVLCCAGGVCEILWHAIFFYEFAKIDYSKLTPVLLWLSSVVAICASVKYNEAIRQALGQRGARVARTLGVITYPVVPAEPGGGLCFAGAAAWENARPGGVTAERVAADRGQFPDQPVPGDADPAWTAACAWVCEAWCKTGCGDGALMKLRKLSESRSESWQTNLRPI